VQRKKVKAKPQRRPGDLPDNWRELPTITIEQARKLLNLSRNAAYEAAKRKEFPVERFGKVWRVPVPRLVRMLDGEAV
jgi:excisionase family DNA binding protein